MGASAPKEFFVDVDGVRADALTVDALARLQLLANRNGCRVKLCGASEELLRLIAFMGLKEVLADAGGLGRELQR